MLIADAGYVLSETNRQASASVATNRDRNDGSDPRWRSHIARVSRILCPAVAARVPVGRARAT